MPDCLSINRFFSGIERSFRARICLSSFCSLVLTRIYPYKLLILSILRMY
nr:MAG TPA: hypothetical protein [Caudoviricetes sp.]DAJ53535.1 MAG TPA: hypothetical protein [Caudoviricetes sp.]